MQFTSKYTCLAAAFCLLAITACQKPLSPQFAGLRHFNVQPLSFASSRITFEVGVNNPNKFDIKVKHLDATVSVAGTNLGEYHLDSTVILAGKQPYFLPVSFEVKNLSLVSNMIRVMAGDSIPYVLSGSVRGGKKIVATFPFSYNGQLTQKDFK